MTTDKFPDLKWSVFLLLIQFGLQFIISIIINLPILFFIRLRFITDKTFQEVMQITRNIVMENTIYISALSAIIASLFLINFAIKKRKTKLKKIVLKNKKTINVKLLLILSFSAVMLALFIPLFNYILEDSLNLFLLANVQGMYSGKVNFVTALIFAPILEEIIFRGMMLDGLLTHYSNKKSIIISAVLFAIFHQSLAKLLPTFIVGVIIAWIYLKSKSVLVCMYYHFTYNLAIRGYFLLIVEEVIRIDSESYLFLLIVALMVFLSFYFMRKYFKEREKKIK